MSHGDEEAPFVPETQVVSWLLANHVTDVLDGASAPVSPTGPEGRIYDLIKLEEGGNNGGTLVSHRLLNWKGLFGLVGSSGGVLTTLADGKPLTGLGICLAAVGLLSAAHTAFTVKIADNHAVVYWTLWVHRVPSTDLVVKEGLLDRVNAQLREHQRSPIAQGELESSLACLRRLRCISDAGEHWRLHEKVWLRLK
jgi:hypothetical protein